MMHLILDVLTMSHSITRCFMLTVYPKWYTSEIIKNIKTKANMFKKYKRTKRLDFLQENRRLKSLIKAEISSAYKAYIQNTQMLINNDPKHFWSFRHTNYSVGKLRYPNRPAALMCYFQNVRGLNTKISELYASVSPSEYDFVGMAEKWLSEHVLDSELFPESYVVFRSDRDLVRVNKSSGGGVLLACRNQYKVERSQSNVSILGDFNGSSFVTQDFSSFEYGTITSFLDLIGSSQLNSISNISGKILDLCQVCRELVPLISREDIHHPSLNITINSCAIRSTNMQPNHTSQSYNFKKAIFP
nr:unnamed protein product [Callosobruchus chinensis]